MSGVPYASCNKTHTNMRRQFIYDCKYFTVKDICICLHISLTASIHYIYVRCQVEHVGFLNIYKTLDCIYFLNNVIIASQVEVHIIPSHEMFHEQMCEMNVILCI